MSKASKKLRQLYGREIRGSFNIFAEVVNDKPKFLPDFIWAWILNIVFKKDATQIFINLKKKL